LRVLTRDLGEAVEVRIRDNGTGISPEIRDKLFQPFVTIPNRPERALDWASRSATRS
jgi:signal transduction histidine kinase